MGERRGALLFLACALTVIALVSVPLILRAGGSAYRWGTLVAAVVLAIPCWVALVRRPR